jgi:diaminopimelate decarboxylase
MSFSRDDRGFAVLGGVPLDSLFDAPERFGAPAGLSTPAYVYDLDAIVAGARALDAGFGGTPHLVAYAVKANSAGPIVRALAGCGFGAEVVSGGECRLALACGVPADRMMMSGVGKTARDLDEAIGAGESGLLAIQIESVEEIPAVAARAKALGRRARLFIRVNPSVEADTHAHVATGHDEAKFGVALVDLPAAWEAIGREEDRLSLVGISSHVGSQLTRTDAYVAAARAVLGVAEERVRAGVPLRYVDFGGGFGIDYGAGCDAKPSDFARAGARLVAESALAGCTLVMEPGRSLVAAHSVLCASTVLAKRSRSTPERRWLLIDAGMNDLLRPALYGARHRIEPLEPFAPGERLGYRVAGPVCESSDDFGEHAFSAPPRRVAIRDAGAYGYTMASEYNGRPLPAEVFLSGGRAVATFVPRRAEQWAAERASIGQ